MQRKCCVWFALFCSLQQSFILYSLLKCHIHLWFQLRSCIETAKCIALGSSHRWVLKHPTSCLASSPKSIKVTAHPQVQTKHILVLCTLLILGVKDIITHPAIKIINLAVIVQLFLSFSAYYYYSPIILYIIHHQVLQFYIQRSQVNLLFSAS